MTESKEYQYDTLIYATQEDYENAVPEHIANARIVKVAGVIVQSPDTKALESSVRIHELLTKIHAWGVARNIIGDGAPQAQYVKLVEEFSEIFDSTESDVIADGIGDTVVVLVMLAGTTGGISCSEKLPLGLEVTDSLSFSFVREGVKILGRMATAVARLDKEKTQVAIDDMMTLLTSLAISEGLKLEDCIQMAYDEIKDRKGVLYDGIFIKSTDERYESVLQEIENRKP